MAMILMQAANDLAQDISKWFAIPLAVYGEPPVYANDEVLKVREIKSE